MIYKGRYIIACMTILLSIIYLTFIAYINYNSVKKIKTDIIAIWAEFQKEYLDELEVLAEQYSDGSNVNWNKVCKNENGRYIFVYCDDNVVFERDTDTTENYRGSSVREMATDFVNAGGLGVLDLIASMENDDEGYMEIIKNEEGPEVNVWEKFDYNDTSFIVGTAMPTEQIYIKYKTEDIIAEKINYCIMQTVLVFIYNIIICLFAFNKGKD